MAAGAQATASGTRSRIWGSSGEKRRRRGASETPLDRNTDACRPRRRSSSNSTGAGTKNGMGGMGLVDRVPLAKGHGATPAKTVGTKSRAVRSGGSRRSRDHEPSLGHLPPIPCPLAPRLRLLGRLSFDVDPAHVGARHVVRRPRRVGDERGRVGDRIARGLLFRLGLRQRRLRSELLLSLLARDESRRHGRPDDGGPARRGRAVQGVRGARMPCRPAPVHGASRAAVHGGPVPLTRVSPSHRPEGIQREFTGRRVILLERGRVPSSGRAPFRSWDESGRSPRGQLRVPHAG